MRSCEPSGWSPVELTTESNPPFSPSMSPNLGARTTRPAITLHNMMPFLVAGDTPLAIHSVATFSWALQLFPHNDVVVLAVSSLTKKFEPITLQTPQRFLLQMPKAPLSDPNAQVMTTPWNSKSSFPSATNLSNPKPTLFSLALDFTISLYSSNLLRTSILLFTIRTFLTVTPISSAHPDRKMVSTIPVNGRPPISSDTGLKSSPLLVRSGGAGGDGSTLVLERADEVLETGGFVWESCFRLDYVKDSALFRLLCGFEGGVSSFCGEVGLGFGFGFGLKHLMVELGWNARTAREAAIRHLSVMAVPEGCIPWEIWLHNFA